MNSSHPLGSEESSAQKSSGNEFKQAPTMEEGPEETAVATHSGSAGESTGSDVL